MPNLQVVFDLYEALEGVHAAVLVTEWEGIRNLDLDRAAGLMASPKLLVDGRNALEPAAATASGLLYRDFGRGS
jgi:UDPglucose 6-dehydrogenase